MYKVWDPIMLLCSNMWQCRFVWFVHCYVRAAWREPRAVIPQPASLIQQQTSVVQTVYIYIYIYATSGSAALFCDSELLLQIAAPSSVTYWDNIILKRNYLRRTTKHSVTWCFSDRASWIDYILITNLMHWLLFIHKILFSSTCFEHQVLIFRRT